MSVSPRLVDVVATGDRRASLEAVRDVLAGALAAVDPRYSAPIAKQLADTMRELDGLADAKVVTPLDEINARRAARGAGAKGGESAAG